MAKFIELHDNNNEGCPVLVNVDWIASISTMREHTLVHIGVKKNNNGNSSLYVISVKESYHAVKEMII